jgi:hypothetical protein
MPTTGASEFHTETFSNARGWIAVRVTHIPTSRMAERERSETLRSAVQAQAECIDELNVALAGEPLLPEPSLPETLTRAEFEALAARVLELERRMGSR